MEQGIAQQSKQIKSRVCLLGHSAALHGRELANRLKRQEYFTMSTSSGSSSIAKRVDWWRTLVRDVSPSSALIESLDVLHMCLTLYKQPLFREDASHVINLSAQ